MRRKLARVLAPAALAVGVMQPAAPAYAFKVETHIWLANKIIADLKRGRHVSVRVEGLRRPLSLSVSPAVRRAILNHPEAYRLGAIGPDALPGIIEGQTVIHPGAERKSGAKDGWGTGEWIAHVMSMAKTDEEVAFAYGMAAHAAADVWAHSYVNHYAGDIFSLFDGEVNVESRHIALEGYIASRTPWDLSEGQSPGAAANASVMKDGKYALPSDFLFRTFVESDEAANAFANGGAHQMKAVHDLYKELGHLARDGGPLDTLHHLIQKAVISYFTDYEIRQEELDKLNKAHQDILNTSNDAIDKLQGFHDYMRNTQQDWMEDGFAATEKALDEVGDVHREIDKLNKDKQGVENDLLELHKRLADALRLPKIKMKFPCTKSKKVAGVRVHYPAICESLDLNPKIGELEQAVKDKQDLENRISGQIASAHERMKRAVVQAHSALISIYETETVALKSAIEFGQSFNENQNPIKGRVLAWRSDVRSATIAYFEANTQAIGNTMTGRSMLDPLKTWLSCEAPKIIAVPGPIMETACSVKDTLAEIQTALDKIKRTGPIGNELMQLRDRLLGEVTKLANKEALSYGGKITGNDIASLADALQKPGSAGNLNAEFVAPAGGLIALPNISETIDRDLSLAGDGKLQADSFHALHNARVLMTLALLSRAEVDRAFAVKKGTAQGNVMTKFAYSIDGDYQWMDRAPPYARASSPAKAGGEYGYKNSLVWSGTPQRLRFRAMFKGPLSPGYVSGPFADALPADYPFRPTAECAYPTNIDMPAVCD